MRIRYIGGSGPVIMEHGSLSAGDEIDVGDDVAETYLRRADFEAVEEGDTSQEPAEQATEPSSDTSPAPAEESAPEPETPAEPAAEEAPADADSSTEATT